MVASWKINGKLKTTLLENSLDQWSCILQCTHIADLSTIKLEILLKHKINWCQKYYWYANGIKHLEDTLKQLTLQKKVWNVESENYNFGKMQMKTQLLVKHWNILMMRTSSKCQHMEIQKAYGMLSAYAKIKIAHMSNISHYNLLTCIIQTRRKKVAEVTVREERAGFLCRR